MPRLSGTYGAKSGKVLVYPIPPLTSLHFVCVCVCVCVLRNKILNYIFLSFFFKLKF